MVQPLDRQYITDMAALVDGVLAGKTLGEPFMSSPEAFWAKHDTAQMVYTLPNLYRPGEAGFSYHAVHLPGNFKRDSVGAPAEKPLETVSKFESDFYLVRDNAGESLFLLRGSTSALLIGTGGGEPGLAAFVHSLAGDLPLDVAVLDRDPRQAGGIAQLNARHVYVAAADVLNGVPATVIADGASIDLGLDSAGKPLTLKAASFQTDGVANLTLLNPTDRVLFVGNAFEKHDAPPRMPGTPSPTPEQDNAARAAWLSKLKGQFDSVYLATNARWYNSPESFEATVSPAILNNTGSGKTR